MFHIDSKRGRTVQFITGVKQGLPHKPYLIRAIN